MKIKVLAIGDVCGEPGLECLKERLKSFKEKNSIDFCVVNGENANVVGITPKQADIIFQCGADVITLGNHTWTRTELKPYLEEKKRIIRPANYGPQCPGKGFATIKCPFGDVSVINLLGRFTLDNNTDNPFVVIDELLDSIKSNVILVDFHAEGTSEKKAMGYMLDGIVSAIWGTHTHVQTSDLEILQNGTGYITDLGMTGAKNSVLGIDPQQSIGKFLGDPPQRYNAAKGPVKMEGCIFEIESETGVCISVEQVREIY